ncbi:MAG: HIT family protein [Patescibacteria group bacterium]
MSPKDCIFCKIIAGEIPNYTIYEDGDTLAFLDIHPCAKGHTVIIPKQHRERTAGLSAVEGPALMNAVQKTMERIQTVLGPDGFNVGWNDGSAAGQVVPHLHIHIFPRWVGDGGGSVHSIVKNPGEMSVAEVAKLFL